MRKNKQPQVLKKNEGSIVRSSAVEYLTFIAASGNGRRTLSLGRSLSRATTGINPAHTRTSTVSQSICRGKKRAKLSRVLGKRALKSFHSRLFNVRFLTGESWSVSNGLETGNDSYRFKQRKKAAERQ
jgi:hypothetical protein